MPWRIASPRQPEGELFDWHSTGDCAGTELDLQCCHGFAAAFIRALPQGPDSNGVNRWALFWCTTQPNTEIDKPRCLPFCFGFPLASITDDLAVHLGRVFLADGLQADIAGTTTPFYFGGPFRAIRPITPAITSTATARKAVGRKIKCPLGCVRIINLYPEDLASDGQPAANHQSP